MVREQILPVPEHLAKMDLNPSSNLSELHIAMICGSWPPDFCGVGDYACRLSDSLVRTGAKVTAIVSRKWKMKDLKEILGQIKQANPDIVHIQYPTISYKSSLVPHFVAVAVSEPVVITLHEFHYAHWLRKIAAVIFGISAKKLIFPNQEDLDGFVRWFPFLRSKCRLIHLGSNITKVKTEVKRQSEVVYFGIIRPDKGLEKFLEAVNSFAHRQDKPRFRLIGGEDANNPDYSVSIIKQARELAVDVSLNLEANDVSVALQSARYAYLPFPGGPSERRCSLFAVMEHGCIVFTSKGKRASCLSRALVEIDEPSELAGAIERLDNHPEEVTCILESVNEIMQKHSWKAIAKEHNSQYFSLLNPLHSRRSR